MLLGAGHDYDTILDWTLPQIELAVESIELMHMKHLDMVITPLLGGMGAKYKSGSVRNNGRTVNRRQNQPMSRNSTGGTDIKPYASKDGEGMLRAGFAMMGLKVEQR